MGFSFALQSERGQDTVDSDGRFVKSYSKTYLVKSDSATYNTLDEAKAGLGVLPGAPDPYWSAAKAVAISAVRLPTIPPHQMWEITVEYSTAAVVPESTTSTDPVDWRVKRRTGTAQQQRFIVKNRLGVLIVDGAGSPFEGGVPVTDYLGTMIFERNETHSTSSMSQAAILSGKINSATFMGCAAGTLMLDVTGEEKYEGGYHFWTFTYTMTYDKEGWQPKPANAGLYQNVGFAAIPRRARILEADRTPVQEPQPLYPAYDGVTLTPLPGSVIPVANRPADCNFITVDHYITFNFTTLGLPTT